MRSDMAEERLINLKEASKVLGCSPMTTRRLEKGGFISAVRLPGCRLLRFRPSTLQRVIEISEKGKAGAA
jgi:excisionase family DNA binding protein